MENNTKPTPEELKKQRLEDTLDSIICHRDALTSAFVLSAVP